MERASPARPPGVRVLVALAGTAAAAAAIGIPTGVVSTPWFSRMTPTLWWNYPVWAVSAVSAVLSGLLLSTYVRVSDASVARPARWGTAGGVLSAFAVGCPVCNKLVVALAVFAAMFSLSTFVIGPAINNNGGPGRLLHGIVG